MPQPGAPQAAPPGWVSAAQRRAGFLTILRAELRKLVATRSDKILVVVGPIALVLFSMLPILTAGYDGTMREEIASTIYALCFAPVVVHAILIKLIAGEWQYRSAQPTLLVQPSRVRYLLAQLVVAMFVWLICSVVQIAATFVLTKIAVEQQDFVSLIPYRAGWAIGICVLGALLMTLLALATALLVPNAAGALAVYPVVAFTLMMMAGWLPEVLAWIDPVSAAVALTGQLPMDPVGPVITGAGLLLALLGFGVFLQLRRDAA